MSAKKQKEIKAKYFHHELGLEDSELKNISILVNDEEYNNYMNDNVNFFHIYVTRPLDNSFDVKKDYYFTNSGNNYYRIFTFKIINNHMPRSLIAETLPLDKSDLFSYVYKTVKIMDFLFSYQKIANVDLKSFAKGGVALTQYMLKTSKEEYPLLDMKNKNIRLQKAHNVTGFYYAIEECYTMYLNLLKLINEKNDLNQTSLKYKYCHILITFYIADSEVSVFPLEYSRNPYLYTNKSPIEVVERTVNQISTKKEKRVSIELLSQLLYENAIINYRIYDEIKDLTKDNYIFTTEINTESNNWYLKRKKNDTLTIIENYKVHPRNINNYLEKILVFTKMHNHYNNKIKEMPNYNDSYYNNIGKISDTTNLDEMRSIIFDNWLDSSIGFSSREILEEKKYHNSINDNSLEFLFSYNVMSYLNSDEYNNNPAKHVLTVINEESNGKKTKEIIDFLENYAEKEENIRLFTTMSAIPFIVKTANEYFNLNIDNKLIRDFYIAYFDYVKFEMHNFSYQLVERIMMILFYLTININNKSEIEKLLHLFPHAYHHLKSFLNDVAIDRHSGKMNIEFNDILYTISKDSASLYLSVTDNTVTFDHYLSILGRFDS